MSSIFESWVARLIFSLISLLALVGNALVLWVFIRKREAAKKTPFEMFIINLAASDLLAGAVLVFSRFLYLPGMPDSQAGAFVFCNFLWGGYVLFGFSYVSIYTCLVLTIERWLAIIKPHKYRRIKTVHAKRAIIIVWVWSFFINSTVFLSVNGNFQQRKCEWIEPKIGRSFFPFFEMVVSCAIPFPIMIFSYGHIFYKMNQITTFKNNQVKILKKRLTIIASIASIALIVGWLPAKISFMLRYTSVGGSHLQGTAHSIFVMMGLGNSCVNPFLYGIYSSRFRNDFKRIVCGIFCRQCAAEETGTCSEQMIPMNDPEPHT